MWRYWQITGAPVALMADEILMGAVQPVLTATLGENPATQFHFLRYADPAFHLRLRVQSTSNARADRILTDLRAALPRGVVATPVRYEPETAKYGGVLGLALAEKWFTASSVLALQILRNIPELSARAAVGRAILQAETEAISTDPTVRARCLQHYRDIWTAYVTGPLPHLTETASAWEFARAWSRLAAPFHGVLQQLEQDGALQCPRASVHLNMAHLFNNRCGLGPAWEVAQCDALLRDGLCDA